MFIGRLEEEKGIKELLKAYRQLTMNYRQLTISLKIIGDGSLEGWIKQWIKENLQWNNVTIEQCNYQDIPKVYQNADILLILYINNS